MGKTGSEICYTSKDSVRTPYINNLKLFPTFHDIIIILNKISYLNNAIIWLNGVWSLLNSSEGNFINLLDQCKNKTKELFCVYISNKNLFIYLQNMYTKKISVITTSHSPKQFQLTSKSLGKYSLTLTYLQIHHKRFEQLSTFHMTMLSVFVYSSKIKTFKCLLKSYVWINKYFLKHHFFILRIHRPKQIAICFPLGGEGNYFKFKDLKTLIYERKAACYSKKRSRLGENFGTQRKKIENMNY